MKESEGLDGMQRREDFRENLREDSVFFEYGDREFLYCARYSLVFRSQERERSERICRPGR